MSAVNINSVLMTLNGQRASCAQTRIVAGLYYDTAKCDCGKSALSHHMGVLEDITGVDEGNDCVYTKSTSSFIISDDLQIFPSETGYALRILTGLGIKGGNDGTDGCDLWIQPGEVMDFLKGSLLSETPLTDLILNKGLLNSFTVKCETCILPVDQAVEQSSSNDKKITLKAILQESTNRLLLVEADGNFLDFLFSLFTIPLGTVECLLGGSTGLKNIDNLSRSLGNITNDKYLKIQDTKTMLPTGYVSKDKILPLIEETSEFLYRGVLVSSVKSPKGPGNYVKGQKIYMVTDDLTVTTLYMASSISIISQLKVSLYDVKELELDIGLKEGLRILKASLTSTSALTDGLMIKTISRKQPKQEHA